MGEKSASGSGSVTQSYGFEDPDPLFKGTDPRIRIRTKMSRIRNTDRKTVAVDLDRVGSGTFCPSDVTLLTLKNKFTKIIRVLSGPIDFVYNDCDSP
jgi:hypothetical protein